MGDASATPQAAFGTRLRHDGFPAEEPHPIYTTSEVAVEVVMRQEAHVSLPTARATGALPPQTWVE